MIGLLFLGGSAIAAGSMCFSPKINNHDGNRFVKFINSFNHDAPKQHRKTSCDLCNAILTE
jgi:hypothetical protein